MLNKRRALVGVEPILTEVMELMPAEVISAGIDIVELKKVGLYSYDYSEIYRFRPIDHEMTVALHGELLGYNRLEVFATAKRIGFHFPPVIAIDASISPSATIGENCIIYPGVIIGGRTRISYNCLVKSGSIINAGVELGHSVTLGSQTMIGDNARVKSNSTLCAGVSVSPDIMIGRDCEVAIPGHYSEDIDDMTLIMDGFSKKCRVVRF